jgi:PAS domain-containing protein
VASINDRELLEAVWEALNVARDNKALAIVRQGTIVNINALAAQLCERSSNELIGKSLADLLDGVSPPRSRAVERWETALKTASGRPIAVEVTRQPLGSRLEDFDVYAIRDLRQRHAAPSNCSAKASCCCSMRKT